MKSKPHPNIDARVAAERASRPGISGGSPNLPRRGYPSLSDDGQSYLPNFPYVRAIALLGIVAILAALLAFT